MSGKASMLFLQGLLFATILAVVWPSLSLPWYGDQALFTYFAREASKGARFYVDFWDNKQPGIVWFYLLSGVFGEVSGKSARLLELFWHSSATLLIVVLAARLNLRRWLVALIPFATLAVFYLWANQVCLGQVEALVVLPLCGCLLTTLAITNRPAENRSVGFLVFGVLSGLIAVFKIVLLLIPGVMLLVTFLLLRRQCRLFEYVKYSLLTMLGGSIIAIITALVALLGGYLPELLWTSFIYPFHALNQANGAPWSRMVRSAGSVIIATLPILPLTACSLLTFFPHPRETRSPLLERTVTVTLAWIAAAAVAIFLQRFSAWRYQFALFIWPIGILAIIGAHVLLIRARHATTRIRQGLVAVIVVLICFPIIALAVKQGNDPERTIYTSYYGLPSTNAEVNASIEALQGLVHDSPQNLACGGVYVFGNPIILLGLRVSSALATHGWAWEIFTDRQWARLPDDLRRSSPDYIFVSRGYADLIARRSADLSRLFSENYSVAWKNNRGSSWLVRNGSSVSSPCHEKVTFTIPIEKSP